MPEIILPIPLNSNPNERNIIIITIAIPGYANKIDAKPTAIAPTTMVPIGAPLVTFP